jgi:hypothetical protein
MIKKEMKEKERYKKMISILASEKFQKNFIAYVDKKEKLCLKKKQAR